MLQRRSFLAGILAACTAPAIIRTPGILMPVRPLIVVPPLVASSMWHHIALVRKNGELIFRFDGSTEPLQEPALELPVSSGPGFANFDLPAIAEPIGTRDFTMSAWVRPPANTVINAATCALALQAAVGLQPEAPPCMQWLIDATTVAYENAALRITG